MRILGFAIPIVVTILGFAPGKSHAQEKDAGKPLELTFQIASLANLPTWRVASSNASGEIALKFEGFGDATMFAIEGYFLLLPNAPGAKNFARVLVTDIDTKGATVKTSPEAAKTFAEGSAVRLVRPFPATTKQLKSIPEIISVVQENGAANPFKSARDATNFARSVNNLKQMGLAFHNFHSAYESLPPALMRGPDGKPWVSWRVLILPFIDQGALYNDYDFTQPWDSEKNLKLLDRMPSVYRDPLYGDDKGHFTNYAVITGEATPFSATGVKMAENGKIEIRPKAEGTVTFASIRDGLSNTIAVVPVSPDRKIPWTKPDDISYNDDFPPLGQPGGIAAPYERNDERFAPVLLLDGSVKMLSAKTQKPNLDGLITKAGGEVRDGAVDVFKQVGAAPAAGVATISITIEGGKATATIKSHKD